MNRDSPYDWHDEWFEYRLLNDPRFLKRIEKARKEIQQGKGISI